MKKFMGLIATFLLFSVPTFALLPPLYEGIKEVKTILASSDLSQKLQSGEVLETIQKNDSGYLITTNKHQLQVDVVYSQTGKIGPAEYELHFHEPIPLK